MTSKPTKLKNSPPTRPPLATSTSSNNSNQSTTTSRTFSMSMSPTSPSAGFSPISPMSPPTSPTRTKNLTSPITSTFLNLRRTSPSRHSISPSRELRQIQTSPTALAPQHPKSHRTVSEPLISPIESSKRHSLSKRPMPDSTAHYGRHANDWLFGGFSVRQTVKRALSHEEYDEHEEHEQRKHG